MDYKKAVNVVATSPEFKRAKRSVAARNFFNRHTTNNSTENITKSSVLNSLAEQDIGFLYSVTASYNGKRYFISANLANQKLLSKNDIWIQNIFEISDDSIPSENIFYLKRIFGHPTSPGWYDETKDNVVIVTNDFETFNTASKVYKKLQTTLNTFPNSLSHEKTHRILAKKGVTIRLGRILAQINQSPLISSSLHSFIHESYAILSGFLEHNKHEIFHACTALKYHSYLNAPPHPQATAQIFKYVSERLLFLSDKFSGHKDFARYFKKLHSDWSSVIRNISNVQQDLDVPSGYRSTTKSFHKLSFLLEHEVVRTALQILHKKFTLPAYKIQLMDYNIHSRIESIISDLSNISFTPKDFLTLNSHLTFLHPIEISRRANEHVQAILQDANKFLELLKHNH